MSTIIVLGAGMVGSTMAIDMAKKHTSDGKERLSFQTRTVSLWMERWRSTQLVYRPQADNRFRIQPPVTFGGTSNHEAG